MPAMHVGVDKHGVQTIPGNFALVVLEKAKKQDVIFQLLYPK